MVVRLWRFPLSPGKEAAGLPARQPSRLAMEEKAETKAEELARLAQELIDLKRTLPEHCFGTQGYTGVHRATPTHWLKIEEIEERIKELQAEPDS